MREEEASVARPRAKSRCEESRVAIYKALVCPIEVSSMSTYATRGRNPLPNKLAHHLH